MAVYNNKRQRSLSAFSMSGTSLSEAYNVYGNPAFSEYEPDWDYDAYSVRKLGVYTMTQSQGFAVYENKIAQVQDDAGIHIIGLNSLSLDRQVTMDIGHGNSCQFSEEFYKENDEFPLFYVRNSGIWVYRIVDTASELVKKYSFPTSAIGTYVAGFGVDSAHHRIYTVSYTTGDYTTKTGKVRFCAWDTEHVSGSGTVYTPTLIGSADFDWWDDYDAIQGCCYHNGFLFVANGYTNTDQKIALIDVRTMEISHTIEIDGLEIEGCSWHDYNLDDSLIVMQRNNATYSQVKFAAYC